MDRFERQAVIGGQWAVSPELSEALAQAVESVRNEAHETGDSRSVSLTVAELRALDDVIQVGARALIANRGATVPAELHSAQRKVQHAYVTFPRSVRVAELDASHASRR